MAKTFRMSRSQVEGLIQRPLFLALDFDGTLAPIVKDPLKARIPAIVKKQLQQLSNYKDVHVAILSGRSLTQLDRFLKLKNVHYAGNHGLEIRTGKNIWVHPKAIAFQKKMNRFESLLDVLKDSFPGSSVENKDFMLAFHYRNVKDISDRKIRSEFNKAFATDIKLKRVFVGEGKKVLELRPPVQWSKAEAFAKLRSLKGKRAGASFYFGDDKTDESIFEAFQGEIESFHVGAGKTMAKYRVSSPKQVHQFINQVLLMLNRNK